MPACRTSQMSICPSGSETPLLPVPDVTEVGDPEGQPGLAEPEPQPGTSTEVPFGQASADQPRGTTTARGVGAPTSREFYDLGVRMLQDYSRHQPHAGTNERIAALANQVMMCQQQIIHLQEQGRLSEQLGRIGNIMEQSIQQQHQTLLVIQQQQQTLLSIHQLIHQQSIFLTALLSRNTTPSEDSQPRPHPTPSEDSQPPRPPRVNIAQQRAITKRPTGPT
ncbi:uncharacterized protein PAF06_007062 [Gastrophryne carolinensis]